MSKARSVLMLTFVFFFAIQLIAVILTYAIKKEIYPHELQALVLKILTVYSVHGAILFGGSFGQKDPGKQRVSTSTFSVAIVLVFVWNLLLCWRTVSFYFAQDDSVTYLASYLDTISTSSSFLVAGVIAYFFTSSKKES